MEPVSLPRIKVSKEALAELNNRIQTLYLADGIPWVVGYSGGKDSTATLQLIWHAIRELPAEQRTHKPIHVISTDTLVESPVVAAWVNRSLDLMREAAIQQNMPMQVHRLTPRVQDSYWVNLIGRGYPAPRQGFRWCTSRLKIEPSNRFILNVVKQHGQAILCLGTRKAESSTRAANMERNEQKRIREWLSPNVSLPSSLVFTPIEDWDNDDVWMYLMQYKNPWERSNKDLLTMYRGASADNECPLVVDTTTPSCGNSRFGCWVCTLVSADKSMQAMIQNDDEKSWMQPLLDLRNELSQGHAEGRIQDRHLRDFRRIYRGLLVYDRLPPDAEPGPNSKREKALVHGPYLKSVREQFLRRVLEVEAQVQRTGPADVENLRLITDEELREIRRIWVEDKHEFDDALPRIYKEVTGRDYPYIDELPPGPFGPDEWDLLKEFTGESPLYHELQATLLDIEQRNRGLARRRGIIDDLEDAIRGCYYEGEEDALNFALHLDKFRAKDGQVMFALDQKEGMLDDDLPSD